jgi:hypothetical protein
MATTQTPPVNITRFQQTTAPFAHQDSFAQLVKKQLVRLENTATPT